MSTRANLPQDYANANWVMLDPGPSGVLPRSFDGIVHLVTAGAETRTLPVPTKAGLRLKLCMKTYVGNCVVTVASAYDETGGTTLTFSAAGQFVALESYEVAAGVFAWRVMALDGVTGPTLNVGALAAASISVNTDGLRVGSRIVEAEQQNTISIPLNSGCVDQNVFIAPRALQITRIDYSHAVAGNDAGSVNLQVAKQTGTQAIGSGTNLLTNNTNAGFNCKAAANTVQNGTLTGTTASLQLAAGDRLALDFSGVVTTLAGVTLTFRYRPI